MSAIHFGSSVTLAEAAALIAFCPENRYILEGEPGIGKSSIIPTINRLLGGTHLASYVDVGNLDLGDVAMPVIDHESRTTKYYPNSRFRITEGQPVLIMLDEFSKGSAPVKNMLHPLLEAAAPRLGDVPLPAGSRVFMTGNLGTDNVGDTMAAHTRNRVTRLIVRKPTADEWLLWAADNNMNGVIMAWTHQYPHALASYTDGDQQGNEFIYNPKTVQTAFVSPRSLARASDIVDNRNRFSTNALAAALRGCLGNAAATSIDAFIAYQDQLPKWDDIINNPKTAPVVNNAGISHVLLFGAVSRVDKATLPPFMEYLGRMETEWQAVFCATLAKTPSKQAVAFSCPAFAKWVSQNQDVL